MYDTGCGFETQAPVKWISSHVAEKADETLELTKSVPFPPASELPYRPTDGWERDHLST